MNSKSAEIQLLDNLQRIAFSYFWNEANPTNGLIADSTRADSPCSITAVGMALSCYPVAIERGFVKHSEALTRTLAALRFFDECHQGEEPLASGYKGFYYHFLSMKTGWRVWKCELSTIDSALLFAGVFTAAAYFDHDTPEEREVRERAHSIFARADWRWALNDGLAVSHGWRPKRGFIKYRWHGYNEALILYVLGLGAPDFSLPTESYAEWASTYRWKRIYDIESLFAGPLFIHQFSHMWIDFRGIQDEFMRGKGIDYFENSRRATLLQQQYALRNPRGFYGYDEHCWGLTASDGPGPAVRNVQTLQGERDERFFDYKARGVPFGPDDGTLAPWAAIASLPFAPEIVFPSIERLQQMGLHEGGKYGLGGTFNPTFTSRHHETGAECGWMSPYHFGIDQGPMVLMIENYRSGLMWEIMRRCRVMVTGLKRAGFSGRWIDTITIS